MPRDIHSAQLACPILIRTSRSRDECALRRLAALESRPLPAGPFLLAEVNDELVAATTLDVEGEPLGDPFLPTAEVRELLRLRARQIRRLYVERRQVARRATPLPEAA